MMKITIMDAGRITTRVSSHGLACPGEPLEVERRAIEAAYETWAPQEAQDEALRVKAWPVREGGGRRRVIVMGWELSSRMTGLHEW